VTFAGNVGKRHYAGDAGCSAGARNAEGVSGESRETLGGLRLNENVVELVATIKKAQP